MQSTRTACRQRRRRTEIGRRTWPAGGPSKSRKGPTAKKVAVPLRPQATWRREGRRRVWETVRRRSSTTERQPSSGTDCAVSAVDTVPCLHGTSSAPSSGSKKATFICLRSACISALFMTQITLNSILQYRVKYNLDLRLDQRSCIGPKY